MTEQSSGNRQAREGAKGQPEEKGQGEEREEEDQLVAPDWRGFQGGSRD